MNDKSYAFRQVYNLFKSKPILNILIIILLSFSFLFVLVTHSYQTGSLERYGDSYNKPLNGENIGFMITNLNENENELLNDETGFRNLLTSGGLDESVMVSYIMFNIYNTVIYDEKLYFINSVFNTKAENKQTGVINAIQDNRIKHGANLRHDSINEALVGDLALSGVKASEIIGAEIYINGENLKIRGVINYYKGIYVYSGSKKPSPHVLLRFIFDKSFDKNELEDLIYRILRQNFNDVSYSADTDYFKQSLIEETNNYIMIAFVCYLFCFLNIITIIRAILYDKNRSITIKLSIGATLRQIYIEFLIYFIILSGLSSVISLLIVKLISPLFLVLSSVPVPLTVSSNTILILLALCLMTSTAASFFILRRIVGGKLSHV